VFPHLPLKYLNNMIKFFKSNGTTPLSQKYLRSGAYLIPEDTTIIKRLILHERKEATLKKPTFYFMGQLTESNKTFYISSLYPRANDAYVIEYKHDFYTVTCLDCDKVEVSEGATP